MKTTKKRKMWIPALIVMAGVLIYLLADRYLIERVEISNVSAVAPVGEVPSAMGMGSCNPSPPLLWQMTGITPMTRFP